MDIASVIGLLLGMALILLSILTKTSLGAFIDVASVLVDQHKWGMKTVQRVLRHASVSTTEKYVKGITNDLDNVMESLSADPSEKSEIRLVKNGGTNGGTLP